MLVYFKAIMRFSPESRLVGALAAGLFLLPGQSAAAAEQAPNVITCGDTSSQRNLFTNTLVNDGAGTDFAIISLNDTGAGSSNDKEVGIALVAPDAFVPQTKSDIKGDSTRTLILDFTRLRDSKVFRVSAHTYPHGRGIHIGSCEKLPAK